MDGVFPVLSPIAQQIIEFVKEEKDANKVHALLDELPATHTSWDDIINVAVQLRLSKLWDPIATVRDFCIPHHSNLKCSLGCFIGWHACFGLCQRELSHCWDFLLTYLFLFSPPFGQIGEWVLHRSSFRPDVICYNLLIEAYGQKLQYRKAESKYLELIEAQCVPTEHTYALLLKAYSAAGLLEKAGAVFAEMKKHDLAPSTFVFTSVSPLYRVGPDSLAVTSLIGLSLFLPVK